MDFSLAPNAQQALEDALGADAARAWSYELPDRVASIARRWSLHPTMNLRGGTAGLVLRATSPEGDVVLKVPFDHVQLEHEHAALCVAQRASIDAMVRVHRYEPGALTTWHVPHTPGAHVDPDAVVALLRELHVSVDVDDRAALRTVEAFAHERLDVNERRLVAIDPMGITPAHVARARQIIEQLALESPRRFVHGDLHPTNVLDDGDALRLIDPKGLLGDPAFDAALWSFKGDKILDRRAWITHFASSGLPEARIRGWMAVIGVYQAISYTFHGKRPDRVRQYVELALECLDRR